MKVNDFAPELRLRAGPDTIGFLVLDDLMAASSRLYGQIVREKEDRAKKRAASAYVPKSKRRKVLSDW